MNYSNWKKLVHIGMHKLNTTHTFILISIVPALLKRWKWLQPGLELSAEAFINLSKCFKNDWKTWLVEDKAAQENRHNKPEAMDIYDTINTQGMEDVDVYT